MTRVPRSVSTAAQKRQAEALEGWSQDPNTLNWNMGWKLVANGLLRRTNPAAKWTEATYELTPKGKRQIEGETRIGTPALRARTTYSWEELGDIFEFDPNYLGAAGGMVPRPSLDALLLITHPEGGKSFDYGDYRDRNDYVYVGRGLTGDQELSGANLDVAENRRSLHLFEHVGPRRLRYVGQVRCVEYWDAIAPDRNGADRRIYRFRLRPRRADRANRTGRRSSAAATHPSRRRLAFRPRPFDPQRTARPWRRGEPRDPDRRRVLAEQADRKHQQVLVALGNWLTNNEWREVEEIDGATDLMGTSPIRAKPRVLFEVKTLTPASERERVRSGLAQLLEYRFFLGSNADLLCLVTDGPIDDRRLQLLDSIGIGHAYLTKSDLHVSGTRASRRIFPASMTDTKGRSRRTSVADSPFPAER